MDETRNLSEMERKWLEEAEEEELFKDPALRAMEQVRELQAALGKPAAKAGGCCGGHCEHGCCGEHRPPVYEEEGS